MSENKPQKTNHPTDRFLLTSSYWAECQHPVRETVLSYIVCHTFWSGNTLIKRPNQHQKNYSFIVYFSMSYVEIYSTFFYMFVDFFFNISERYDVV